MSAAYLPHYEWAAILGASLFLWCYGWVWPRFGGCAASLLGYLGINTLWVWVYVENRYVTINPYDQMALRYFAADSFARLLILVVPLMLLAERRATLLFFGEAAVKMFVVINSLWIASGLFFGGCSSINSCGGAGNPSIMVGLTVCALPLVIHSWRKNWLALLLVIVAVLAAKSSVAYGLFGLYLSYAVYRWRPRIFGLAACAAIVPLLVGSVMLKSGDLFNSGDRFLLWSFMMPKWAASKNILFGAGFGTYHVFSINLQNAVGVPSPTAKGFWWDSMHNDWLQMVFECGAVSGILMIATYFTALCRMLKSGEGAVFMAALLYGIYMFVNPALHHALPALFGAWLFVYALKRDGYRIQRPLHYY